MRPVYRKPNKYRDQVALQGQTYNLYSISIRFLLNAIAKQGHSQEKKKQIHEVLAQYQEKYNDVKMRHDEITAFYVRKCVGRQ